MHYLSAHLHNGGSKEDAVWREREKGESARGTERHRKEGKKKRMVGGSERDRGVREPWFMCPLFYLGRVDHPHRDTVQCIPT